MSKKKRRDKKYQGPKLPKRPEYFNSFRECVDWLKKSVYMIARGREVEIDGKKLINWTTLGSGFVAAPNRFLTAAHVINDPQKKDDGQHRDNDKYFLVRHDDTGAWHYRVKEYNFNNELFVYSNLDLAIIYLDEEFYQVGEKKYVDKNEFIRISMDSLPIGYEIGVLGYPLCKLDFKDQQLDQPLIGDILLRTDTGVVNCRYNTKENICIYEFTLAFNPGNSGGPIFDVRTGRIISIVRGYRTIPIATQETIISEEVAKQLKTYSEKSFIEVLHANYSVGFATSSFQEVFKTHNIIN